MKMLARWPTLALALAATLCFLARAQDPPTLAVAPSTWREEVQEPCADGVIASDFRIPAGLVERMIVDAELRGLTDSPPADSMRGLLCASGVFASMQLAAADGRAKLIGDPGWVGHGNTRAQPLVVRSNDGSQVAVPGWGLEARLVSTELEEREGTVSLRARCEVDVGAQAYELRLSVVVGVAGDTVPLRVEWSGPFAAR